MTHEAEIYIGGDDPYMMVVPIQGTCITEIQNTAYALAKEYKAEFVTFGPTINRDEDGSPLPLTIPKKKR